MTKVNPTAKHYKTLISLNKKSTEEKQNEEIMAKNIEQKIEGKQHDLFGGQRWDTWNIRGPKNTRIVARNKLRFSNTAKRFFKNHLKKTDELVSTYDWKLSKKLNIYKIPEGVYPNFQGYSEFYNVNLDEYSDCWDVILTDNNFYLFRNTNRILKKMMKTSSTTTIPSWMNQTRTKERPQRYSSLTRIHQRRIIRTQYRNFLAVTTLGLL